jgi:hypothetical protein
MIKTLPLFMSPRQYNADGCVAYERLIIDGKISVNIAYY